MPCYTFLSLVMTKGADQLEVCSKHDQRENTGVVRNYGSLLVELSTTVPDGIICYFPSAKYMEFVLIKWNESGILQRILDNKLIFVETRDPLQTITSLSNYKQACDSGRGAVLFANARSCVTDGIRLSGHYSRCAVVFGVPFVNTLSRTAKVRM